MCIDEDKNKILEELYLFRRNQQLVRVEILCGVTKFLVSRSLSRTPIEHPLGYAVEEHWATMKEGGIKREMMKWTATMNDVLVQAIRNMLTKTYELRVWSVEGTTLSLNLHYAGNCVEGIFSPLAYSYIIKELKTTIEELGNLEYRILDRSFYVLSIMWLEAIREGNSVMEKSRPHVYFEEDIFNQLVAIGIEIIRTS
ncbi:hypothetical protein M9H77_03429 [Catharanthus roseus]|uniref:Uncharacterized protein n=1 Tax=Catharanthus roseus TaxID=4058 RepID=A0ACC0CBA4_CATRO|nr:hypothetical protein M9H77_03429 [Catharanthus roseus]